MMMHKFGGTCTICLMVTPHPSHFIVHILLIYMHVMHLLFILQDLV